MPRYLPGHWSAIDAGDTVLDRSGRMRLILAIEPDTLNAERLIVTTAEGTWPVDRLWPVLLVHPADMSEALRNILTVFPDTLPVIEE